MGGPDDAPIRKRFIKSGPAWRIEPLGTRVLCHQTLQRASTFLEQQSVQLSHGYPWWDLAFDARDGVAVIDRSVGHTMDSHAGAGLASDQDPERWARATMGRQQCGMDVQHGRGRRVEEGWLQDLVEMEGNDQIRPELPQQIQHRRAVDVAAHDKGSADMQRMLAKGAQGNLTT